MFARRCWRRPGARRRRPTATRAVTWPRSPVRWCPGGRTPALPEATRSRSSAHRRRADTHEIKARWPGSGALRRVPQQKDLRELRADRRPGPASRARHTYQADGRSGCVPPTSATTRTGAGQRDAWTTSPHCAYYLDKRPRPCDHSRRTTTLYRPMKAMAACFGDTRADHEILIGSCEPVKDASPSAEQAPTCRARHLIRTARRLVTRWPASTDSPIDLDVDQLTSQPPPTPCSTCSTPTPAERAAAQCAEMHLATPDGFTAAAHSPAVRPAGMLGEFPRCGQHSELRECTVARYLSLAGVPPLVRHLPDLALPRRPPRNIARCGSPSHPIVLRKPRPASPNRAINLTTPPT